MKRKPTAATIENVNNKITQLAGKGTFDHAHVFFSETEKDAVEPAEKGAQKENGVVGWFMPCAHRFEEEGAQYRG